MTNNLQAQLERYYRENLQETHRPITKFTHISDGWETDVYRFDLGDEALILRLYPGVPGSERAAHEFATLRSLYTLGYPVPAVKHCETDTTPLGRPFIIMERINGRPVAEVISESEPAKQAELFARIARLFVDLHRLDWRPFIWPGSSLEMFDDPLFFVNQVVAYYENEANTYTYLQSFQPVIDWLKARIQTVPLVRPGIIHADFHANNMLMTPDDRIYVIDWASAMAGDTLYDLAWTLLLATTFGRPELYEPILSTYEQANGATVTGLAFYEVIACLRRLVDILISLFSGAEARGMRSETTALLRGQAAHIHAVFDRLKDRSGLALDDLAHTIDRALGEN